MSFDKGFECNVAEEITLKKYLGKGELHKSPKRNPADFELMRLLNKAIVSNRDLAWKVYTMAFSLQMVMKEDPSIQAGAVVANLFSIAKSLDRQRNLAKAVNRKTAYTPTDSREQHAVKRMCSHMRIRADYISRTIIPGNLKMTPVYDYLQITGRDWDEDLEELTGFLLSPEEIEEKRKEYIIRILNALRDRPVQYRKELDAYNMLTARKAEEKRRERKEHRLEQKNERLDARERSLAVSSFHFEEDLRVSLQEGKYFETVNASRKDLEKNPALRDGFIVLQTRYNKQNAETTHYYKEGTGKKENITVSKLASATVMTFEKAKAVCDRYYDKGHYLGVVFSMKELRAVYDPSADNGGGKQAGSGIPC